MEIETEKAFQAACYAPYVSMEFDPVGNVYGCCVNQLYPLGNVLEGSLDEIWHGARARHLREALAEGDLTSGCNVCRWHIEHGNDAPVAVEYGRLPVLAREPEFPTRMTFAMSNRCNLECVMCNGELSSKIRTREGRAPLPQVYDDAFFEQLAPYLDHLAFANFLGGEPFLAKENFRVWDLMAARGLQTRCHVVTNGTRFDAKVQRALDQVPMSFDMSVDGATKETLESIRLNVDRDVILANAARFRDYAQERGTAFGFMFCLMVQNWHEFGSFLAFADDFGAAVSVISVTEPGFSVHDLPTDELRAVVDGLEAEADHRALGRNRGVWDTELEQIRRTMADREAGVGVTIRQPTATTGPMVVIPAAGASGESVAEQAGRRLERWAHGGGVFALTRDSEGIVVDAPLTPAAAVLGVDTQRLVGCSVDDILRESSVAQGRSYYAIDHVERDGVTEQTFITSATRPSRGAEGTVVRVVTIPTVEGSRVLLAVDRFYDGDRRPTVGSSPAWAT